LVLRRTVDPAQDAAMFCQCLSPPRNTVLNVTTFCQCLVPPRSIDPSQMHDMYNVLSVLGPSLEYRPKMLPCSVDAWYLPGVPIQHDMYNDMHNVGAWSLLGGRTQDTTMFCRCLVPLWNIDRVRSMLRGLCSNVLSVFDPSSKYGPNMLQCSVGA
jgi:hypothetical protein